MLFKRIQNSSWFRIIPAFNSLFWRLFLGLLIAILATAFITWSVSYFLSDQDSGDGAIDGRLGGKRAVDLALYLYNQHGMDSLVQWLQSSTNAPNTVYLINRKGEEITRRPIPEKAYKRLVQVGLPLSTTSYLEVPLQPIEYNGTTYFLFATLPTSNSLLPIFNPFSVRNPINASLGLVVLIVLTLLIAFILALHYSSPLRRLDTAMRRFAEGALGTRIATSIGSSDEEAMRLARVFDQMATEIEKLVKRQQRLFHDVSHEIRSPLARIEIALELARRDPARLESSFTRIETEIRNIDRLIEALLTRARLSSNTAPEKHLQSMRNLMQTVHEASAFEGQAKGITVKLHDYTREDPILLANEDILISAISNITRNALRYTPENGTIELILESDEQSVTIKCKDQGPGIPEEAITQIFEPFIRVAAKADSSTGFGLGLAIARAAVENHGGTISAQNCPEGGLIMSITLPLNSNKPH